MARIILFFTQGFKERLMTHLISPKTRFVTMTSVAALMAVAMSGTSAQAVCTDVVTGTNVAATCAAATNTGYTERMGMPGTYTTALTVNSGITVTDSMVMMPIAAIDIGITNNDSVTNKGTIVGKKVGLRMGGGSNHVIQNEAGATISGGTDGVVINNGFNDTLTNDGTIKGGTGAGLYVNGVSLSLFTNAGEISSTSGAGINIDSALMQKNTVRNRGNIFGGGAGVGVLGGLGEETVENVGTIAGGSMSTTAINLGEGNDVLINGNNVNANATIGGDVVMGKGDDKIENYADIKRTVDMGDGNDQLTNTGVIGSSAAGIGNVGMGNGDDTVTNSGTITGSISLGDGANVLTNSAGGKIDGSITAGTGDDVVTNSGSIGGNIHLGDGNDKLTLNMGMSVGGTIDGGNGNDSLILSNKGVQVRETLSNTIVNFDNLVVDSNIGDVWVLNNNYTFGTKVDITTGVVEIAKMMTLESATVTLDGVVASGRARLQGEGTIKGDLVVTKGIVTAGNAPTGIGTLSVTGDYTNSADGYLDVSVGPGSDQTKLAVTRNVTLGGTLRVSVAAGFYKNGASYDVITFGGTRTGQFATANLPTASKFTKFKVNYAPKAVQVQVEKLNYNTVGNTYNQRQAGDGLFRGMAGSGAGSDMETVAKAFEGLGANDDAYRAALDSLSGEGWAAMGEVRGSVTRNFRALGMGRIDGNSEGVGVWGNVLQGQEDVKGDGNGERIRGDVRGLVGGVEYGFGGGKVGIMVGYGQGELKLHSRGEGEVKLMMGGVYGGWNLGGIEVSGGVSYASGKQKVERHISVGGTVQRDVRGSEQVREFGMDVGVGYGINLGMIKVTPQVGLEMARVYEQGFEEKGGDAVSLSGEKEKGWEGRGHVSMEVSAVFQVGLVSFEPYVKGGYERVLVGKGYQDRDVSFQQPGTAFNVRSTDGSKNIYTGGGGLNVGFGPVTLGVGYQQSIGGKRDERTFQGSLGIRW